MKNLGLTISVAFAVALGTAACAGSNSSKTPPRAPSTNATLTSADAPPPNEGSNKLFDANAGAAPDMTNSGSEIASASRQTSAVQYHAPRTAPHVEQGQSSSELAITAGIRREVSNDATLSFGAKNATIITKGNTVVLRGTVADAHEKYVLESYAKHQPGVSNIDDDLETAR